MKKCSKCKITKKLYGFYKQKDRKDGLRSQCMTCIDANTALYYKINRERELLRHKSYNKENAEKMKPYYETYGVAYRNTHREKMKGLLAKWRKENPDKMNSHTAKRRAAKLERTPSWLTKNDFKEIQKFYSLAHEKTRNTNIIHEVDHIVPLQGKNVSGLHVPWNLQVITKKENGSYYNKLK